MRFLIDENMGLSYAKSLRTMGLEAIHVAEVGLTSTIDEDIVMYAYQNGCVVITFDLDFTRTVALSRKSFPSILTFRLGEINVSEFETLIQTYMPEITKPLLEGALVTIDINGLRIKRLPVVK